MSEDIVARDRFLSGFLCSQSVFSTFAPQLGLSEETAYKIAAPFGAGMGGTSETCGAVTGALMVIGLKYGDYLLDDKAGKELVYQKTRQFMAEFRKRHDTLICRELQGHNLADPDQLQAARQAGVFEKVCPLLVQDAAEILSVILSEG